MAEHFDSKIIGLDEAFEVLEEADVKIATGAQKEIQTTLETRKTFQEDLNAKRRKVSEDTKKPMQVKCERVLNILLPHYILSIKLQLYCM